MAVSTAQEDSSSLSMTSNQHKRRKNLLRLIFYRFSSSNHHRSRRSSDSNLLQRDIALPERSLRILTHEEAIGCHATCRFCLGQTEDDGENDISRDGNNNPFVSPCNCTGGQEFVHLQCVRQWQRQAWLSPKTQQASEICLVCRCKYLLPPLALNERHLGKGTLLVCLEKESKNLSTGVPKTSVLLLHHRDKTTCGLILNVPLRSSEMLPSVQEVTQKVLPRSCSLEWRQGGPVCGGRLGGVTRYCIAHTLPDMAEMVTRNGNQRLISAALTLSSSSSEHDTVETEDHLQFVFDSTNRNTPATFSGADIGKIIQCLSELFKQQQHQTMQDCLPTTKFIIFSGYCKWRGGQLQREIKNGSWGVCNTTTARDIMEPVSWEEIRSSDRLLTRGDLLEEVIF